MCNSATTFTLTPSAWDALDRLAEAYGIPTHTPTRKGL